MMYLRAGLLRHGGVSQGGSVETCWCISGLICSDMLVYLRAQTIVHAATQTQKQQTQLATSPSHSLLTPGQPVLALNP